MKLRNTIVFAALLACLTAGAQIPVSISGYVTAIETGFAIPDKEVNIALPPGQQPITTTTNNNGYYATQFVVMPGDSLNQIIVMVTDCEQQLIAQTFNVLNNNVITADFQICSITPGCTPYFSYEVQPAQPLIAGFHNLSTAVSYSTYWFWDFGDGSNSIDFEPVHTYNQPGIYPVCLTMIDSMAGCTALYCADVVISNNNAGCLAYYTWQSDGLTLQFTDLSQGNPTNRNWDFGDGTGSIQANPAHTYASPGVYGVCLTIGNDSLNCSDVYCINIEVGDTLPQCHAAYTYFTAGSNTLAFNNFSTGTYIYQYIWDFGDGTTSFEFEPVHTWPQAGIYHVCLAVVGPICGDVFCSDVTVGDTITACHAEFTAMVDSIPGNVNHYWFTDTSTGTNISNWYWDFGDGSFSYLPSPEYTFAQSGTYTVCHAVSGTGNGGYCADTVCHTITTPNYHNLGGQVFAGNFPINNPQNTGDTATVSLYHKTGDRLTRIATGNFYEYGYYYFVDVPEGDYVVHGGLTSESASAGLYLPAYSGEARFWQQTLPIGLHDADIFDADVHMPGITLPESGYGSISGNLLCIDNTYIGLEGNYIYLSLQNSIVAYTQTGWNGDFSFNGLPLGSYTLKAEIPGVYSQSLDVNINEVMAQVSGTTIQISHSAVFGIDHAEKDDDAALMVYPNPASERLFVKFSVTEADRISCRIVTPAGTLVSQQYITLSPGENLIGIGVHQLPAGVYGLLFISSAGYQVAGSRFVRN